MTQDNKNVVHNSDKQPVFHQLIIPGMEEFFEQLHIQSTNSKKSQSK